MDHRRLDDAWAPVEATLEEPARRLATVRSSSATRRDDDLFRPEVLARLPDLDAADPDWESAVKPAHSVGHLDVPRMKASDGRIISHGLSTKILVGVAALLVLAAILPFLFGGDDAPKPGTSPAPDADEAPVWNRPNAEAPEVPPASGDFSYEPDMSFTPELPPAPDFIGTAQDANPNPPPQKAQPAAQRQSRIGTIGEQEHTPAAGHQSQAQSPWPRAQANRTMTIGDPILTPHGIYADNYRPDYQAETRANLADRYPDSSIQYQTAAPGVARLQGIIEKPSVRTSHDAARSSFH